MFGLIIFVLVLASFSSAVSLTVTAEGKGYVSSSPSGILCGYACKENYDAGTRMVLTAKANEGFSFLSWEGACEGSELACSLVLDGDKEVTATFSGEVLKEYALTVYKTGNGQGKVSSDPFGITLGVIAPYDSAKFAAGTEVMLTATPLQGSTFKGWSGACKGEKEICSVVVDAVKEVTASFSGGAEEELPVRNNTSIIIPPSSNDSSIIIPPSSNTSIIIPPSSEVVDSKVPKGIMLTVVKLGSGAVTSKDKNISCGSKCAYAYEKGTTVTLDSVASSGYVFGGWEGCESEKSLCVLTLKRAKKIRALFFPSRVQLAVNKTSGGHVTSSDYKIFCGQYCVGDYAVESKVSLTATPSIGAVFKGWGGACAGTRETCVVEMNTSANVSAEFEVLKPPAHELSVEKNEGGEVVSLDNGIKCGGDCNETYKEDEEVTLVAKPFTVYHDAEKKQVWYTYIFEGWSGACIGSNASCVVEMDVAKRVVARFKQPRTSYKLNVNVRGDGTERVFLNWEKWCPGNCSAEILFGKEAILHFETEEEELMYGLTGPCNLYEPNASNCIIANPSGNDVEINISFMKDWNPSNYKLNIVKTGSGNGEVLVSTDVEQFVCAEGEAKCSKKIPRNAKVTLTAKPKQDTGFVEYQGSQAGQYKVILGSKFKGWKGSCTGTNESCTLLMDSVKNVTAEFSQKINYKVTVVKQGSSATVKSPFEGTYGYYGFKVMMHKISCGFDCEDEFEGGSVVKLTADKDVAWKGCDAIVGRECILNLNANRIVTVDLSDAEKAGIAKQALAEVFSRGNYEKYNVASYVQSEENAPFKHTIEVLARKEVKSDVKSVREWIEKNEAWFLNQGGVQALIDAKKKDFAKQALLAVFASETAAYPALNDFLVNENNKPFQTALADLNYGRNGGTFEGLKSWIQGGKEWYLSATGIQGKINELKPKPPPPPVPPSITSISPQARQIGKPTVVRGANFKNIQRVTVGPDAVAYTVVSESEIVLPYVPWGMGSNPTVTVETSGGRAWAPLVYNKETVIYNADGKLEECFGAVGKGCGGLTGGMYVWGNSELWASGCMAEVNGHKTCWVVPGSIRHDNCCVRNPGGKHCGGPGTDGKEAGEWNHNGMCVQEWHEAVWDTFWKRGWQYTFRVRDYNPDLTPGVSPYGRYPEGEAVASVGECGATGHELRQIEDYKFCCSGSAYINSKKCV